jgi:type VI secretion system protein ImpL
LQADGVETTAAAVRRIRDCLNEAVRATGVSIPVYVLFTKADRMRFFAEFTRNLSHEEANQVLGVTLPLRSGPESGVYAEQETQRLNAAFHNLVLSLSDRRVDVLSREHDSQKLGGIYEFPRELSKLRARIIEFLVDLSRPSQLRTSPFLRGFYFSGVRAVIVNEVAQAAVAAQSQAAASHPDAGATAIFKGYSKPGQPPIPQPQVVVARKVPQWAFLTRLFGDVILKDRLAMAATSTSLKTNTLRRILLGAGAALCLLISLAITVSYFGNRSLESDVAQASCLTGQVVLIGVTSRHHARELGNIAAICGEAFLIPEGRTAVAFGVGPLCR